MNKESLKIILRIYSKGELNEDEAIQLIEDLLFNKTTINNYPYTPYWIDYINSEPKSQKYEITCKTV